MRFDRTTNRHRPLSNRSTALVAIAREHRRHRAPQVEALEDRLLLSAPGLQSLVNYRTGGFYNAALGMVLDETQAQFPCADLRCGDPTIRPASEPNLAAAAGVFGNWLAPNPFPLNSNWSAGPQLIPSKWTVNTETAIIYPVDAGARGLVNVKGNFGVDNGIFVWMNGVFKFGALASGPAPAFEYSNIDLGNLHPGLNLIQVLREDHGGGTGYCVSITGELAANEVPTISDIPSQQASKDAPTGAIVFAVGDVETAADSLTVTGSSSNPSLVPNENIVFGGSGTTRTITITPAANQSGTSTITVTVSDGTASASDQFVLTVNPVNDPQSDLGSPVIVVAGGIGSSPLVRVFDAASGVERFNFMAYAAKFRGGVRVATGDVSGDGVADIITGAGAGMGPQVRVFDGQTGLPLAGALGGFDAFEASFKKGILVAAGDVDGDGQADIITARGAIKPEVRVFSGNDGHQLLSFMAYDATWRIGVRVAAGDVDGDGRVDIITGTGPGGQPLVRVFDGQTGQPLPGPLGSFVAGAAAYRGGISVAAGNVNADGRADIIVGEEQRSRLVRVYNAVDQALLVELTPYEPRYTRGVCVGAVDVNGDGLADIVLGSAGSSRGVPSVRMYDAATLTAMDHVLSSDTLFARGVFVAGGR